MNFKGRFLGTSRTDSNCHGDICPGNISPGDICPYQEYLSCYWPEFYQTLQIGSWECLEQISTVMVAFVQAIFVLTTFVHIRNTSAVTNPILTSLKGRFLGPALKDVNCHSDICLGNIYVLATFLQISNISSFLDQIFGALDFVFWTNIFFGLKLFFWPNMFFTKNCLYPKLFESKIFWT